MPLAFVYVAWYLRYAGAAARVTDISVLVDWLRTGIAATFSGIVSGPPRRGAAVVVGKDSIPLLTYSCLESLCLSLRPANPARFPRCRSICIPQVCFCVIEPAGIGVLQAR